MSPKRQASTTRSVEVPTRSGYSNSHAQTDEFDGNVIVVKNESDVAVQTEPMKERPPLPKKPPTIRAVSKKTCVQSIDLWSFHVQVQPVARQLVQKALAVATMEYAEELELEKMASYLKAFEHHARVEAEGIARLVAAEEKRFQEKEALLATKLTFEAEQTSLRQKIAARGLAEYLVWDVGNDAMDILEKGGFFFDELEVHLGQELMPWLEEQVAGELQKPVLREILAVRAVEAAAEFAAAEEQRTSAEIDALATKRLATSEAALRKLLTEDIVADAIGRAKVLRAEMKKRKRAKKAEEEADGAEGAEEVEE